jgi:hypothetical protein
MGERFKIELASPPDREKLVANIFFGLDQWTELNQEKGTLTLEERLRLLAAVARGPGETNSRRERVIKRRTKP